MDYGIVGGILGVLNPYMMLLILLGVVVGIIFGAIPGLTAATALALFLPVTFGMEATAGIVLLIGLYIGGISGGLIPAIILRMPGTPSSIATTYDGSPMALRGEAGKALGVGIVSSFIGGIFSTVMLIFIAPAIAKVALRFGPWEYFAIGIFSLSMISSLVSQSVAKGLGSAIIGLLISMIGAGPVDSVQRLTFGFHSLEAGLDLLPVMVGLFAVSELLKTAESVDQENLEAVKFKLKGFGFSLREFFGTQKFNLTRSALIGLGIGILPGMGGSTSNLISYLAAKNQSKHPEKFGTGIIDGLVASETANNSTIGGALIPLMTLGIPGDGVTALLLGAFLLHGISPGPLLFVNQGPLVYSVFGAVLIANLFMLVLMYLGLHPIARILKTPKYLLLPIIMIFCSVGAYSVNNRIFDIGVMLVLGVFGFYIEKLGFSLTPIVMGFILGPIVELNLRRGLMASKNSILPLFESPVAMVFLLIGLASMGIPIVKWWVKRLRAIKNTEN